MTSYPSYNGIDSVYNKYFVLASRLRVGNGDYTEDRRQRRTIAVADTIVHPRYEYITDAIHLTKDYSL